MSLYSLGGSAAVGLGSQLAQNLPVLYPALQQLVAHYSASCSAQAPSFAAPAAAR
jgi:hypothetical protein